MEVDPFFRMTKHTVGGIACHSVLKEVKVTGVEKTKKV